MREAGVVRGHHLFLVPADGALKDALKKTINTLSATYGGPVFEPHLTIAAEIEAPVTEIKAFAKELAQKPAPKIIFDGIRTGNIFFKCCYLAVGSSPELVELNYQARKRFSITNIFEPHMSIAYGRHTPEALQAMAQTAEDLLADVLLPTVFPYLELWETEGKTENWKRIAPYTFSS